MSSNRLQGRFRDDIVVQKRQKDTEKKLWRSSWSYSAWPQPALTTWLPSLPSISLGTGATTYATAAAATTTKFPVSSTMPFFRCFFLVNCFLLLCCVLHDAFCLSAVVCLIAELGWFFYSSVNYRWLKGWKLQTVLVKVTTQVDEPATGEESNFCHPVSTIILLTSPYQNVCHIFWYLRLSAVKIDDQTDQSLFWQIYLGTWIGEHSQI